MVSFPSPFEGSPFVSSAAGSGAASASSLSSTFVASAASSIFSSFFAAGFFVLAFFICSNWYMSVRSPKLFNMLKTYAFLRGSQLFSLCLFFCVGHLRRQVIERECECRIIPNKQRRKLICSAHWTAMLQVNDQAAAKFSSRDRGSSLTLDIREPRELHPASFTITTSKVIRTRATEK